MTHRSNPAGDEPGRQAAHGWTSRHGSRGTHGDRCRHGSPAPRDAPSLATARDPAAPDPAAAPGRAAASDRGAAAVELALILPVLLLIVFGIIDFGRMLNAQITLTEAAREGARAEALGADPDARVQEAASRLGTVTTGVDSSCPDGIDAVVTVQHQFTFVTPISPVLGMFGESIDGTVSMSGKGVMPCFSS